MSTVKFTLSVYHKNLLLLKERLLKNLPENNVNDSNNIKNENVKNNGSILEKKSK